MYGIIIFWGVLLVAFVVVEFATAGLTSIWFALGALGALISAAAAPTADLLWLQVAIFLIVSGVAIYYTRPLAKRYHRANRTATNANRVLEMVGVVREPVDNLSIQGAVFVGGKLWSAKTDEDEVIPPGTRVDILRIDGAKLIVRPVQEAKPTETIDTQAETTQQN